MTTAKSIPASTYTTHALSSNETIFEPTNSNTLTLAHISNFGTIYISIVSTLRKRVQSKSTNYHLNGVYA